MRETRNFTRFIIISVIIIAILAFIGLWTDNLQLSLLALIISIILLVIFISKFLYDFFLTDNWISLVLAIVFIVILFVSICWAILIAFVITAKKTLSPIISNTSS